MRYRISPEHGISDYFFCMEYAEVLMPLHVHSHIEFVFLLSGSLQITIGDRKYSLSPGEMAVIMPYEIHSYAAGASDRLFVLACPPEYIAEYRQLLRGQTFSPPHAPFSPALGCLIADVASETPPDDLRKKSLLYCALSDLTAHCSRTDRVVFDYDLYRRAVVYITENCTEHITLRQTAAHIGVTPTHLSRVLNGDGKPGFSEILNSMRSFAAKQLLEQTSAPIIDIALETGFGSVRNFNRVFLKTFGCTPGKIRKKP